MLKIGLTGNLGSGKTVVSKVFSILGIPVYHADDESKKFLEEPGVINEILKHFGYGVLTNNREINKRSLASLVFSDEQSLRVLNSILHPKIIEDFRKWTALQLEKPYVIQEAAIIFESGLRSEFDYMINVSCPKETAINRVINRDKVDGHSVLRRMQFQMDDEAKSKLSDFKILNDGIEMVIPQVLAIHRHLLQYNLLS
jgi:dephospho-CoA kinase